MSETVTRCVPLEYRSAEGGGDTLNGVLVRYGDVAATPAGPERISAGAFGDVSSLDVIANLQHQRTRPLARSGGGGLTLTDDAESLAAEILLPDTTDGRDTAALVKQGVLRGLSLEFAAVAESRSGGVRQIDAARLLGLGVVDKPAYPQSLVELRQTGRGLTGAFRYNRARTRRRSGRERKEVVRSGAFARFLRDPYREVQLVYAGDAGQPLASRLAGSLRLADGSDALRFVVDDLPDTSYARDLIEGLAAGAFVGGIAAQYSIPPESVVPGASEEVLESELTDIDTEPGDTQARVPGVTVRVVHEATLYALSVQPRPPLGNAGELELRQYRRRWWF